MKPVETVKKYRFAETEYNALTDSFRFKVIDYFEDIYEGDVAESRFETVDTINMTCNHLKLDYGSNIALENLDSAKKDIEEVYQLDQWGF